MHNKEEKPLLQSIFITSVISANHTTIQRVNVLHIFERLDTQWDQTKAGQTRTGQTKTGQTKAGHTKAGQTKAGQTK
jgi:hypothetical protein